MADAGISIYLYIGYCGNLVDLNVMKYYCLLLSFLWGLVVSVSGQERISVCNLRCEYLEDPVAVENEKPLLSWQLQSSGQAKKQTAYRVLVASTPSLLAEGKADFWDSGKIVSSRSCQVGYEGKPLIPGKRFIGKRWFGMKKERFRPGVKQGDGRWDC